MPCQFRHQRYVTRHPRPNLRIHPLHIIAQQRRDEAARSGTGRFGVHRYRGYRGLSELPWFELDTAGGLRCVADDVPLAVRQARATSLDALLRRFPREDADDDSAGDEGDDAPIDVLKIDCEGHDPAVLRGARATLRRTRVLMFEVSGTGEWAGTRFSDVIQELDEAGFTCFWAGAHGLLRLTGCFHPTFDTEWWHRDATNAICASRVLAPSLAPLLF